MVLVEAFSSGHIDGLENDTSLAKVSLDLYGLDLHKDQFFNIFLGRTYKIAIGLPPKI